MSGVAAKLERRRLKKRTAHGPRRREGQRPQIRAQAEAHSRTGVRETVKRGGEEALRPNASIVEIS